MEYHARFNCKKWFVTELLREIQNINHHLKSQSSLEVITFL